MNPLKKELKKNAYGAFERNLGRFNRRIPRVVSDETHGLFE